MSRSAGADPIREAPQILGLGTAYGDDQLGWIAIDRLRPLLPEGILAAKVSGGHGLLECLVGQNDVVIVDALAPAGRPGNVRSFAWPGADFVECAPWSSHGLGVLEALRFAEALGRLPLRVSIETVEAQQTLPGALLSSVVSRGLDDLIAVLLRRFGRVHAGHMEGGQCTKPR